MMSEAAHEAFPNLTILARAYDRRHAYELLKTPKVGVERETFESALSMGRKSLMKLGSAAMDGVRDGDEETVKRISEIINKARKDVYSILAED